MSNVFSGVCTVGRDAEVRYLPSGQAVLNVTLANNVGYGDNQKTNWVRGVLWGKRAEGQLKDYLKKGQQVFISGELTTQTYKKNDGTEGFALEVNATTLDLVGKKSDAQPAPTPTPTSAPAPSQQSGAAYQAAQNGNSYSDDIPF